MNGKAKVGDTVWYVLGNTSQQAQIIAIAGSTHATIKMLTGPQRGQEFEAPWGVIQPLEKDRKRALVTDISGTTPQGQK